MTDQQEPSAGIRAAAATEGLSQLIARILNQLAISAWLPSAALVLMLAFVVQLGEVVGGKNAPDRWFAATTETLHSLGEMSAGSYFLLAAAVVVLTMLTQAFTFEAIRLLEGYWGIRRPARNVAQVMCRWHRFRQRLLLKRQRDLILDAWAAAHRKVHLNERGKFTEEMFAALDHMVTGEGEPVGLPDSDQDTVDDYDWLRLAPHEQLRQLATVEKRLRDYPSPKQLLPTRLGNVLRHFESQTGAGPLESTVEERFDALPFSLRVSHDEQRGRLDLYASMTLVWLLVAVVAALRFVVEREQERWQWGDDLRYGVAIALVCFLGAWFSYRAAVTSARYYGELLVRIAAYPVTTPPIAAGPVETAAATGATAPGGDTATD